MSSWALSSPYRHYVLHISAEMMKVKVHQRNRCPVP
jgi:hypothetical protein